MPSILALSGRAPLAPRRAAAAATRPVSVHAAAAPCGAQAGAAPRAPPPTQQPAAPPPPAQRPAAGPRLPPRAATTAARLRELAAHVAERGSAAVPLAHPGGLGRWAAEQRHRWRRGRLPVATYRALAALGFDFDAQAARWAARWRQLAAFHDARGDADVQRADAPPGLYTWTLLQRQLRRQGRLDDDRARRLDGLGFVWEPVDARWAARLAELEAHTAAAPAGVVVVVGRAAAPAGLATWVETQRGAARGRGRAAPLTPARAARLRATGLELERGAARRRAWDARLAQLRRGEAGADAGLRAWAARQRAARRAGRLAPARAAALDAAGFDFEPRAAAAARRAAAWAAGLAALDALLEAQGFAATHAQVCLLGADALEARLPRGRRGAGAGADADGEAATRVARWFAGAARAAAEGRLAPEHVAALADRGLM